MRFLPTCSIHRSAYIKVFANVLEPVTFERAQPQAVEVQCLELPDGSVEVAVGFHDLPESLTDHSQPIYRTAFLSPSSSACRTILTIALAVFMPT